MNREMLLALKVAFRSGRFGAQRLRDRVTLLAGVVCVPTQPPAAMLGVLIQTRVRLATAVEILNDAALGRLIAELANDLRMTLFPSAEEFEGELVITEGPLTGRSVAIDAALLKDAQDLWRDLLKPGAIRVTVDGASVLGPAVPNDVDELLKEALALPLQH
ncbi:MAG: hypothetical protein H6721_24130 [Sandaracinus sp.]|nr:hypothetical protein [Sandaracinus sp.]MCB9635222.1 hypothetical protein [Sandaracinus sp.]